MSAAGKFIIYAPRYRNESGGSIVLHKLCDTLNRLGYVAKLWPLWKPRFSLRTPISSLPNGTAYYGSRMYRGPYIVNDHYDTPIAKASDIEDSVVVYPEIVSGNPLGAHRYVRWFLHKPGFHEGKFKYTAGDLCFSYQDAFNSLTSDVKYGGTLTVTETFSGIYQLVNDGERTAICHMVRKGKIRTDLPDLSEQWVVDGHTHEELAKIFNECKICFIYDLYTMYSAYAALCGCVPVIVPVPGMTKTQWVPEDCKRFGLAYGNEDIPHAVATRGLLLEGLHQAEQQGINSVEHFVSVVDQHFYR